MYHFIFCRRLALPLICFMLILTSCSPNATQERTEIQQANPSTIQAEIKVGNTITYPQAPIQTGLHGEVWLPLKEAADSFDYVYEWDAASQTFAMGYRDVLYTVKMGSTAAETDRGTIQLPQAPRLTNANPYITIAALEKLWETNIAWNNQQRSIVIDPVNDADLADTEATNPTAQIQHNLKNVNEQALLRYAYRFKGVPYRFGAAPYERSRRFDCSSFTRHVFKKFGVSLPRTARAQGRLGHKVSLRNLQPGDMLFFYVPGRFKTNRVVGHNAIYIGNGKIIHTYGKPGVTISSIRSGYWRNTFMFAKRMVD